VSREAITSCVIREWAGLPAGGTLRVAWPLHDSWLRLMSLENGRA
jgi:hypothetical protein